MRNSSAVVVAAVIVAVLAANTYAAPCPHFAKRQADWSPIDSFMDPVAPDIGLSDGAGIAGSSVASAAWPATDIASSDINNSFMNNFNGALGQGSFSDPLPVDSSEDLTNDNSLMENIPADSFPGPAAPNNDNLVGNSVAQVDDSINVNDTDIQYPGESQLTDNTGTAVSGNNNDIAPIINAPVTVIINSNEDDHEDKRPLPALPNSATPAATALAKAMALARASTLEKGGLAPQVNPLQTPGFSAPQRPLSASAINQVPANDITARIEQLVSYAMALSRSRF
ncbi:hypothetical protein IWW36_003369 [Coemansia brasiliensis]|uniref:Uncharacterized protein n=1 Tax=Coemansia brasiliensis TaxID=2650707 RepID=A0A9W8LYL5_9FUNG|nr:hypothetical protein IWW36_003369 [Coemansia brasiliensis]